MPSQDSFYADVVAEIERGQIDKAMWAKAFAHSGGTEEATKSLYVRYRAEDMVSDFRSKQIQKISRISLAYLVDIALSALTAAGMAFLLPMILGLDELRYNSASFWFTFSAALCFGFIHFRKTRRKGLSSAPDCRSGAITGTTNR